MTTCIYHEDKTVFESFRRYLQTCKVLPRNLSPRLAMAVCSCRKTRTTHLEVSEEDYMSMKEDIKTHFKRNFEKCYKSPSLLKPLDQVFYTEKTPSLSEKYLTYILHKAIGGSFELLEEERRTNTKAPVMKTGEDSKGSEEDDQENDQAMKSHKMTLKQIRLMVRKRKRKMPIFSRLDLPIHGNSMYLLTAVTGRELKGVAQRFRCYIEIDWASINDNVEAGIPVSSIKVWCRTQQLMDAVKRYFNELMATRAFLDHVIFSKEYKQMKDISKRWESTMKINYCLTDHFTEKVLGRKKPKNRYVSSRQRVKTLPSALGSVLCERCLQSYKDVLVNDRPCFFHPGTIVESDGDKLWSCCDVSAGECCVAEEHRRSGCWKGSHIWNLSDVVSTPVQDCRAAFNRPKHKLKWAVVGYAKAF